LEEICLNLIEVKSKYFSGGTEWRVETSA